MLQKLIRVPLIYTCFTLAALGCTGTMDDGMADGGGSMPTPPLGAPITAMANTWTWVDFPDAVCDDGTPTGVGVNLAPNSNKLLVFLMGGGACWDYKSCAVDNSSTHGPFGEKQFNSNKLLFAIGSVLDRKAATPFGDYNMVFVPYCTGDVHIGDNVAMYSGPSGENKVIYHKGRPNLVAFLKRIAATVPSPDKLVVSGSSAGGFGAALNYDLFRTYFPKAHSYLLDDSGPPMIGDAIPKDLRAAWYSAWNLTATLSPICPNCSDDFSTLVPILGQKYPQDRMALLSNNQDSVISGFFGNQSAADFEKNLYAMASAVLDPLPNFHYYFTAGTGHTFLFTPGFTTTQGVKLPVWLTEMEQDDAKWTSLKP